jgi:hypothetical protein
MQRLEFNRLCPKSGFYNYLILLCDLCVSL